MRSWEWKGWDGSQATCIVTALNNGVSVFSGLLHTILQSELFSGRLSHVSRWINNSTWLRKCVDQNTELFISLK